MSEKKEHLDAIKADLADIHRRLSLICDGSANRTQRRACLDTTEALIQVQNQQIKDLRRAYLGRA